MNPFFVMAGQSFATQGRSVLVPDTGVYLAVDAYADLAVDEKEDFEISDGSVWLGKTTAITLDIAGREVTTVPAPAT